MSLEPDGSIAAPDKVARPLLPSDMSLSRRLRFAGNWVYRLDTALLAVGLRRRRWLFDVPHLAGNLICDLFEAVRTVGPVPHVGQAYLAALNAPVLLPQDPRYRGYWYDPQRHSLVGMVLGLDLNRYEGKYHFTESNLSAAMRPERRQLYKTDVDPVISGLAKLAKSEGFARLVLLAQQWTPNQLEELERAGRQADVELIGANVATMDTVGYPMVNPMLALPEQLPPRTMYVIFLAYGGRTPLRHFIHNKLAATQWLTETIAEAGDPTSRLACIPTFDHLVVPPEPPGERWPNLVVKLAGSDQGKAIVMGRFSTLEEARRGLQLADEPGAIPAVLENNLADKIRNVLFREQMRALYQPFIPPEVINRRARLIRVHLFISPLADTFLSAHGVIAGEELPDHLPLGLVKNDRAYIVNFSKGSQYDRLESAIEKELEDVAREYGRLAKLAIEKKFVIRPQQKEEA